MDAPPHVAAPPVLTGDASSPGDVPRRPRWRSVAFLAIVGFYPLLVGVLGHFAAGHGGGGGPALPGDVRGLAIASAENFLLFALLFGAAWFFGRPTRGELHWRPLRWWDWLWGGLWSLGVRLGALVAIYAALLPFLLAELFRPSPEGAAGMTARIEGLRPKVESLVDFRALEDPLYVLVAATLLSFVTAGLREELWRAGFMAALRDLLPRRLAEPGGRRPGENRFVWQCRLRLPDVLLSLAAATVFGLGHLPQGVGGVVLTGVVGFILGLVMILHRSLWTAVIAHGFFDATTFVLLGLIVRYREEIRKIAPDMLRQIGL